VAGIVGGTASVLGGGKFANGAYTAAFQHLLNYEIVTKAQQAATGRRVNRLLERFENAAVPEFSDKDFDDLLEFGMLTKKDIDGDFGYISRLRHSDSLFRFRGWNEKIFKFNNTGNSLYPASGLYIGRDINYYAVGMTLGESRSAFFSIASVAGYNFITGTNQFLFHGNDNQWQYDYKQIVTAQPWARAGFSYYVKNVLNKYE
jgi:hypothetical protein